MQSKLQFYHFQKEILDKFESEFDRWDKKIHIVAPPGSWKTIMWIEMINRLIRKYIPWNILILVPNITLQYQWKEKMEMFFLEETEKIDDFISTDRNVIKKVNIITYQSISSATDEVDDFLDQIQNKWYQDIKDEFISYEDFLNYVEKLKETDIKEYWENINKYKKKLKLTNTKELLSDQVKSYLEELKKEWIAAIVVDEAHHLTSWWSKVLYYAWEFLEKPFIIWLTATPPFDNSDFFVLNEDYTALLWEVDYYVPTPAIVKAWRLAPYSDLVYFVEPNDDIKDMMKKNDIILNDFLEKNKNEIWEIVYKYVKENYDKLLKNSQVLLNNYLRFLYNYTKLDISEYAFSESVFEQADIEDIAKSTWKYIAVKTIDLDDKKFDGEIIKTMFYNLGFIWRWNNFYKFRTPVEMALVYAKSKMNWINKVLEQEFRNKWNTLKCAIITDFLEEWDNNYINCKFILNEINKLYPEFNTILVSGQWIWKYENNNLIELDLNILEVTKKLESWEINLIVWTRWILWEWWDCPKLNVLIDLTWVSAFMSVNQIRWRAIRLDTDNNKKVANIYDIVCLWEWYKWKIDFERAVRKYENFYWVDASWVIIKGIDHIYPDLEHHIVNYHKINDNMLKRSALLEYIYDLWWIGWNYENKEIFGLNIEIDSTMNLFPFVKTRFFEWFKFSNLIKDKKIENISEMWKESFYFEIIKRFIRNLLDSVVKTLIKFWDLPLGFNYEIKDSVDWNYKIVSEYKDALVSKTFISHIKDIFSSVSSQRYMIDIFSLKNEWSKLKEDRILFPLPNIVAKNTEYRDEIEWNLSDSFLKIIYWRIRYAYKKSFTYVNDLIKKLKWIKLFGNSSNIIIIYLLLWVIIFVLISLLNYSMIFLNIIYWILGLILLHLLCLLLLWILIIILNIYINIYTILVFTYWLLLFFWSFLLLALLEDETITYWNNYLLLYLSIFYWLNLVFFWIILFSKKIMYKYLFLFFSITNKKQIITNNKLTKTWINSDYVRYIYLNSPDVNKKDYVWKKPFINSKIEKLWI